MLDWILKYKVRVPGALKKTPAAGTADPATAAAAAAGGSAAKQPRPGSGAKAVQAAAPKKVAPPAPVIDWDARLQAALGDNAALMALAQAAAPLPIKLAAIDALAGEEALKEAERALRNRDRRVHSLAKQRALALRTQRETRAQAAKLIDAAQTLAAQTLIPVNSAVELDRAWSVLDAARLQPEQREAFAALTTQLSTLTRQRADHEAALKRWAGEARQAVAQLQTACTDTASGAQPIGVLSEATASAQALATAVPPGAQAATTAAALNEALATAWALAERLVLLDQLLDKPMDQPPDQVQRPSSPSLELAATAATSSEPPMAVETVQPEGPAPAAAEEAAQGLSATPAQTAIEERPPAPAQSPTEAEPQGPAEAAGAAATPLEIDGQAPSNAPPGHAAEAPASAPAPVAAKATPLQPAQQWKLLPPLADSRLNSLLEDRFEAWQRAQEDARQQQRAQRREQAQEHKRAARSARGGALAAVLTQAEARLAEGLVAETHKHLIEVDELLHAGAPADALRARIERLQDGYAELRGWQHWAGGRARDDLTQEAEALATSCAPGPAGQPPKLQLKAHADLIDNLRARWRELDRLGGASSRALWQRFDGALKAAYEPLAAHKAAQSAVREQNLAARQQLLDALEGVAVPTADEAQAGAELRPAIVALDQFRVEWRKLGPLEHTVPHKARDRLAERMNSAVQRLQAPLDGAWGRAQEDRKALIERAQALAASAQAAADGSNAGGRDWVGEVRALQAHWQQCAKALPLPRNAENALWTAFRSALDAVFSARDAAFSARDAEFKAYADERVALIERLEALGEETPGDTRRTLAEVDTLWQRTGPAPRAQAATLDQRYWRAREAAQQWLAGSQQRGWLATCDALAAKLALCEARERNAPAPGPGVDAGVDAGVGIGSDTGVGVGVGVGVGDGEGAGAGPDAGTDADADAGAEQASEASRQTPPAQQWAALPALPQAWEDALRQRAGIAGAAAPSPHAALGHDAVLLQLEAAWNLPSPPACAAARRDLQLQAMKAALETRRSRAAEQDPGTPDQWLAEALRRPASEPLQRQRLGAVLTALRQRGPSGKAG